MKPVPILLYSDNPTIMTGLARITRHLAILLSGMPEFRVGTFGRGGVASRKLPWPQYYYPESAGWGQDYLPLVWHDFAGTEPGVIFTIMDPYRMHWFSQSQNLREENPVRRFLEASPIYKWGYFPIDHMSTNGGLSDLGADAVKGYDVALAYTLFGAQVLSKALGRDVDWLPHGINENIFYPRGREGIKYALGFDKHKIIGCVATNQVRKDWGMAFRIVRTLIDNGHNILFWVCVDEMVRYWNMHSLAKDYGVEKYILWTEGSRMDDQKLAHYYSMCDCTILPTGGEGFGYPIAESLACGTPCVTINYAGGAELVNQDWLVEPVMMRQEAAVNALRPVSNVQDWVDKVEFVLGAGDLTQECVELVRYLGWNKLGERWRKWFRETLEKQMGGGDEGKNRTT